MIRTVCPQCAQEMQTPENTRGQFVACVSCGRHFQVNAPSSLLPPALPSDAVQALPPASRLPAALAPSWLEEDEPIPRGKDHPRPGSARIAPDDVAPWGEDDHPLLGRFVRDYGNPSGQLERPILIGCSVVVVIVCPILFFVFDITWVRWVVGIVGVLSLLVGFGTIIEILEGKPAFFRVRLYEQGFYYEGEEKFVCLWDDIFELRDVGLGENASKQLPRVRTRDGATISLDPKIKNIQDFATLLVERASEVLLADAENRLEREGQVSFGRRIRIRPQGLEMDRRPLAWDQILEVRVGPGERSPVVEAILRFGERREVEQVDIANLPILIDLLRSRFDVRVVVD